MLVEYTLQTLKDLEVASKCRDTTEVFFKISYPQIFAYVSYHPSIGVALKVMGYIATITWAYRDIFIVNLSLALKVRFCQINRVLDVHKNQAMTPNFWWQQRSHYRRLASLVNEVDKSICAITLLSVAKNVSFLCFHLFNSL